MAENMDIKKIQESMPDYNAIGLEVVEHLGAKGHFTFNHAVRCALHGERFSAHDHLITERHDVRRQVLIEKTRLSHHVVDASRVELLETLTEFLERNREFVRGNVLTLFNQAVKFHKARFFGLGSHIC